MPAALRPVVATAAGYALFTLLGLALHGWTPLWFVWIGERWSDGLIGGRTGYDGQFVYYLARDGWAALPHLDTPGYRLSRILYPALAALLGGRDPQRLPWAMLAINYAAVVAGTAVIARWLAARDTNPWWAAVYPACAGMLFAYSRDCTEPLAYGLAVAGTVAWIEGRRGRAWVLLALAPLARETTALFTLGLAAAALAERRWPIVAGLAASVVPTQAWQTYIRANPDQPTADLWRLLRLFLAPRFLVDAPLDAGRFAALMLVALPTLALLPGAIAWVARAPATPLPWLIALNAILVLVAPAQTYLHVLAMGRVGIGLVIALLLAFPVLSPRLRGAVALLAVLPTIIWLAPMLWWAPWTATR